MSFLINGRDLDKSLGNRTLFTGVNLVLHEGDRVGMIGPNGSGKSTLLAIMAGKADPDRGEVQVRRHLRVSLLPQHDRFPCSETVTGSLLAALAEQGFSRDEARVRAGAMISRAGFPDPDQRLDTLSGGWRKRLAICRALVTGPDVLLLDEPTNHLDIEGILWLERLLTTPLPDSPAAFLLVSHDRRFLENTVNRLVELSPVYPGGTLQVQGSYSRFLLKRQEFLGRQAALEERLANRMRRESEWLRRSPKARTSKSRSRIEAAEGLRQELADIRRKNRAGGQAKIDFTATGRKTKKLLTARGLSCSAGRHKLFSGLDLDLSPGARVGLVGANGCGKTTLMRVLAHACADPSPFPPKKAASPAPRG